MRLLLAAALLLPQAEPIQKVEGIDEGRRIAAGEGSFADDSGPLAVHLYRIER